MKKPLIITNVITLVLLAWSLFHCYMHQEHGQTKVLPAGTCSQTSDPGPFDFGSYNAKQLVKAYTNDHWDAINTRTSPNKYPSDSRSVWFSLSRLKGFIQAIETQTAAHLDSNCCGTLGIRIYFGEYTPELLDSFKNVPGFNSNNQDYLRKTTLLMIPTYRMTDGKDHDFNPSKTSIICNAIDTSIWNAPTIMALMMNHGGIIPPPFPSRLCNVYMGSGADFMIYAADPISNLPSLPGGSADISTYCPN